jgi:transposase
MIQRGGDVVMRMLANVQQVTIKPLIQATITPSTWVYTDEYDIYSRLEQWGYAHENVCHSDGEYARDDDGDGFCEMHVNTMEGFWSLLRSWLRPHRGISQEHLLSIWVSLNSCTTSGDAVKPYWERYLSYCSPSSPESILSRQLNGGICRS